MEGADEVGEKTYANDIPAVEKGLFAVTLSWHARKTQLHLTIFDKSLPNYQGFTRM